MTLTTHAIAGVALAGLTPNSPLTGFAVGFVSHFVLDAIPHWDYYLASMKRDKNNPMNDDMLINRNFVKDLFIIGFDGVLGLLLAYLIFGFCLKYSFFIIFCGVAGAMLPDALQFVHMKWRHEPFASLRRFHHWIQSRANLDEKPVAGVLSQLAIILIIVWLAV